MSARSSVRTVVRRALAATRLGRAVEAFPDTDIVCLTWDDGPDPVGTTAVLEALSERGARGTFFVMANRVRQHPSVLLETAGEGHEIALHGPDHRDLTRCSPAQVRRLTRDSLAVVEDVLGAPVRWFRPPYVGLRLDGWLALRGLPLRFVASGSAIPDWEPHLDDAARIAQLRTELSAGDVVLAHDSWAGPEDNALPGPEPVVDRGWLARRALDLCEERGLGPVTLTTAAASASPRTAFRVALRPQPAAGTLVTRSGVPGEADDGEVRGAGGGR